MISSIACERVKENKIVNDRGEHAQERKTQEEKKELRGKMGLKELLDRLTTRRVGRSVIFKTESEGRANRSIQIGVI